MAVGIGVAVGVGALVGGVGVLVRSVTGRVRCGVSDTDEPQAEIESTTKDARPVMTRRTAGMAVEVMCRRPAMNL